MGGACLRRPGRRGHVFVRNAPLDARRSARFPAIGALVDSGIFEGSDAEDAEFAFGLERILDGLAALMPDS
jgi:Tetracyclin repressor-like, C-terminal domain